MHTHACSGHVTETVARNDDDRELGVMGEGQLSWIDGKNLVEVVRKQREETVVVASVSGLMSICVC